MCAACRGIFPAAGSIMVCSRAPNYIAAHSTEPAQIVHQDLTNPLVRTLKLKKSAGKTASRKRKGSPASAAKCATCTYRARTVGFVSTWHPRRDGMLPSVAGRVAKQAAAAGGILPRAVQQVHFVPLLTSTGISSRCTAHVGTGGVHILSVPSHPNRGQCGSQEGAALQPARARRHEPEGASGEVFMAHLSGYA